MEATGDKFVYQWYYRSNDAAGWWPSGAADAQSATFTVKALAYRDGYSYRCGITSAEGMLVYTDAVWIHIVEGGLPINESNFPDALFREAAAAYDQDNNGRLSDSEIAAITVFDVSSQGISDMNGIEKFTALQALNCSDNAISELDLSANTALQTLNAGNNTSLETVLLPETLAAVTDSAFTGCTELTEITLPASVTAIGANAFLGCTSLESVILSDNVSSIGQAAFKNCTELRSMIIQN